MLVTVPPGVFGGQQLQVQTPAGLAQVQVPQGMIPGGQFRIQVNVPAERTYAAQPPPPQYDQPRAQPRGRPERGQNKRAQTRPVTRQPARDSGYVAPALGAGGYGDSLQTVHRLHSTGSPVNDFGPPLACQRGCYRTTCGCYTPCCCFCLTEKVVCVRTGEAAIITRFGKFARVGSPGVNLLLAPLGECVPFEKVDRLMSMRVQEASVSANTKTKDNVFVKMHVSVLYRVAGEDRARDAAYKLQDVRGQLEAYVEDTLRSNIARLLLDDVFTTSKELARAVYDSAAPRMLEYGYEIVTTLVTGIEPEAKVKTAMNEINMQRRLKEAQVNAAEASKALEIKRAEASAEAKYLSGVGLSRMRKAMIDGFALSVATLNVSEDAQYSGDATELLLTTQYLDTLEALAHEAAAHPGGQKTKLHLPTGLDAVGHMRDRLAFFKAAFA